MDMAIGTSQRNPSATWEAILLEIAEGFELGGETDDGLTGAIQLYVGLIIRGYVTADEVTRAMIFGYGSGLENPLPHIEKIAVILDEERL